MLYWVNFLHIYQPPNQDPFILQKVSAESYELILELLKTYPRMKLTLNVSGALISQLNNEKYLHILQGIKMFAEKGRVELVGSAMYHPILSLLPEEEIERQIALNNEISGKVFGEAYKPKGFFIPEMAYSDKVGRAIREAGFSWVLLDEAHFGKQAPHPAVKYKIRENGLIALFRNRRFSKTFPPEYIVENLNSIKENYLITAHDGELYGHWHKDFKGYYDKAFNHKSIRSVTVSEYLEMIGEGAEDVTPKKTNWEATTEDMAKRIYFALWNHPNNTIHELLWQLARLAMHAVASHKTDPNYSFAREHLDKGLSSCAWWWAAGTRPIITAPITWNPDVIEKGLRELIKSMRSLKNMDKVKKIQAEKIYARLIVAIWSNHWNKFD